MANARRSYIAIYTGKFQIASIKQTMANFFLLLRRSLFFINFKKNYNPPNSNCFENILKSVTISNTISKRLVAIFDNTYFTISRLY